MSTPENPETKVKIPQSITFFPNNQTAVGNERGRQMPKYQGRHAESIALLAKDGIDWRDIPEIYGSPQSRHAPNLPGDEK